MLAEDRADKADQARHVAVREDQHDPVHVGVQMIWPQLHQTQELEAMGLLAGGFAHHFNNMLMGILRFTELMLAEEASGSARWNNLQHVFTAALRARDLVLQLLMFSRPTPLLRRPVHFLGLLRDTITGLRAALPATITLRHAIAADPSWVLGDATELHQIIVQLWANAVDAMRQTGGVLDVRLDRIDADTAPGAIAPALQPGTYVRCTICDTGPGIPPDLLDHIFEPFFTTKASGAGTGMGLAIVQRIVTSHGGCVTVSSGGGAGATFVVYLPRLAPAMVRMLQEGLPEEGEPRGRGR